MAWGRIQDVTDDEFHAELRHLRAENHRLREDVAHMEERLAYAQRQIDELRAKVVGNMKQVAAPGGSP